MYRLADTPLPAIACIPKWTSTGASASCVRKNFATGISTSSADRQGKAVILGCLPLPAIPFLWHTVPAFHPFSTRLFPPMKQGRRSVPQSALQSKVRKAVPEQRQSASCRSMPELRRMSKQHGIPLCKASCRILLWHIPPLIRIFSFRAVSVMGKR